MGRQYIEDEIRQDLQARCQRSSQKEVAEKLGLSEQYLSDLVLGRRNISRAVAALLGYSQIKVYFWIEEQSDDR